MKTSWSVSVAVNGRVGASTGDVTLAKALERGIQSATYYKTVYPESTITIQDIFEQCATCWNTGKTNRMNGRIRKVRCPECRGKGAQGSVDPITFRLSGDSSKITLIQTAP